MKIASVLLSLVMASVSAHAAVTKQDLNGDGNAQAFYDATNKLYWTDANVFGQLFYVDAGVAVANATFEGITNWRLPTVDEFKLLYAAQGHVSANDLRMNPGLFTNVQSLWYWTADPTNSVDYHWTYTPSANSTNSTISDTCCAVSRGGSPYTWAVASVAPVPEPETYAMLLAGLGVMGFIARRRKQA